MADSSKLRDIVERVVSDTLNAHVAALKDEIAERASHELEAVLPDVGGSSAGVQPSAAPLGGNTSERLNAAFSTILDSNSQAEILSALLGGTSKFCQRSALFVVKSGNAVGWRAQGFADDDGIKSISFDPRVGLAGRAYVDRQCVQAAAAEFDSRFISTFGEPLAGTNAVVLPLVLRDKVSALVYADGGSTGKIDPSALECLTRAAGLWLEIVAARKAGTPVAATEAEERTDTQKIPVMAEPAAPTPAPALAPETAPAPAAVAAAAAPSASVDDEEIHKKAKRFAKLLVDEIKLYNQQKVADGRANKDLYSRLKDDIDKSRISYEKRYGQTAAGHSDYFNEELIRILCDGDASVLGSGYSR